MFKYAKIDLQNKLEILEKKYEKTALESKEIEEKRIKLDNYLTLMSDLIHLNILLVVSFAVFCMSLLAAAQVGVSIIFGIISVIEGGFVFGSRKIIKENYSEFLDKKKLFLLKDELSEQEAIINNKKDKLISKIEEYKKELEQVKKSEEEAKKIGKFPQNPYYLADTKEDYQRLSTEQKKGTDNLLDVYVDSLLDIYLNEKLKPATVHYDNKMGDNIQYTESSKKLFKKM